MKIVGKPTPAELTKDATPVDATPVAPLICGSCNLSARFRPMYRFNQTGATPAILFGGHPATIECMCGALYVWGPPTAEGVTDGGWMRTNRLNDLELVRP